MKKRIAWVVVVLMLLSSVGSYAIPAPVAVDIATELQEIYSYLEVAERTFLNTARSSLQSQMTGAWPAELDPLLTVEALACFADEATAKEKIQAFILGMTEVYFNTESTTIASDIDAFIDSQATVGSAFMSLFGDSAYLTDLMELLYDTKVKITSTLDGAEKLSLATASNDEGLISAMESVVNDAVIDEINTNPAYTHLAGVLGSVGWDIATLMTAQNALLDVTTEGAAARVAIANATVRSEAVVASGDLSPYVGDTVTYSVSFFGQETNLFELSSQSALVSVSGRQVTAEAAGTATIYVHRIGGSTVLTDYDYIHKFDITITTRPTTVVTPPAPVEEEPEVVEDTTETVEDLGDTAGEVADEAGATEVMENAEAVAEDLANLVETVDTEEEAQQLVENVVTITEAVSQVSDNVVTEEGAVAALDSQTSIVSSVVTVLGVVEDPAEQEAIVESTQTLLAASDDLIGMMTDPAAAEEVASELIAAAAPLLEEIAGSESLSESLSETLADIAQSYVEVASTITVDAASTTLDATGVALTTLDEAQILQMAAQSSEAIMTMNEALVTGGVESPRQLEVGVTLTVPAVTGAQQYESVLPVSSGLLDAVDHVAIQTPIATIQLGSGVLEGQSGQAVSVGAGLVATEDMSEQETNRANGRTVYDFTIRSGGTELNDFSEPLVIRMPVEWTGDEDPSELTMFNLLPNGEAVPMGGHYANGIMTYRAPHTSRYFVEAARKSFDDVSESHWAKDYIELLAGKGIISGKSETAFDPNAPITRAEFTVLLMKAMAYNGSVEALAFGDVTESDWFAGPVAAAYQNGIVGGKAPGVFAPYDYITREEMAKMIANVLVVENYTLSKNLPTGFSDYATISIWAAKEVRTAVREGIISGRPDGSFMPKAHATRAEAATMVYQLFVK